MPNKGYLITTTKSIASRPVVLLFSSICLGLTNAHDHQDVAPLPPGSQPIIPPGMVIAHIILQLISWGILLPIGVILGIRRSRAHVPLQLITSLFISLPASTLPHLSSVHPYPQNLHSSLASFVIFVLILQSSFGLFLRSHTLEGSFFRSSAQTLHSLLGKTFPLLGWIQMLLGGIASLSTCYGDHLGQCLAHFIMGSAFIGYGILMLIVSEFGKPWLGSRQISLEYLDCCVITAWGIVNTFTEHGVFFSAGWHWSHKDFQHTFLGVIWACGGGLGIYLSRGGRRSVMSGLVIIITGWTFLSHQQSLEYSTKIHGAFGFTLMAAGLIKTIWVIYEDQTSLNIKHHRGHPNVQNRLSAFDHLIPLLLTISGVMFMSANEEQLMLIMSIGMDHATYVLCQASLGCLIYLYFNLMLSFYKSYDEADYHHQPTEHGNRAESFDRNVQFSLLSTEPPPSKIDLESESLSLENLSSLATNHDHIVTGTKDVDDESCQSLLEHKS